MFMYDMSKNCTYAIYTNVILSIPKIDKKIFTTWIQVVYISYKQNILSVWGIDNFSTCGLDKNIVYIRYRKIVYILYRQNFFCIMYRQYV